MSTNNLLGLPTEASAFPAAEVLILPIPFEATVSYGGGTRHGPQAIIDASQQVELYDREFGCEPALRYGIHTLPALELSAAPASAVAAIATATADAARTGKLVVGLGGEHTVSAGFGRGLLDALGGPLTVVQIDAHCDLRDHYEGSPFSHACVARRLLDDPRVEQVLQLGIRSLCVEEAEVLHTQPQRVRAWFAEQVHDGDWRSEFVRRVQGRRVYLTIDVDGLDPSIMPATGTPEPDGLTWNETLDIVRTLASHGTIVGVDCVELAPVDGLHASDFAAAKLVYKVISCARGMGR
jgi:agmatinase